MSLKHSLRKFVNKFGLDVQRFPEGPLKYRMIAIHHFKINSIFDIGANYGQYALLMRKLGYKGKIISFEPLTSVFKELERKSKTDRNWHVENIALGNKDTYEYINISENTHSSSILNALPSHISAAPDSKFIGKEKIEIKKLDNIFSNYFEQGDNVLLKIDTQGYEKHVLEGAIKSIEKVCGVQIEMSLVDLYEGNPLFLDMINFMEKKGFHLYGIQNGFANRNSGQQLQIDGTFYRKELL